MGVRGFLWGSGDWGTSRFLDRSSDLEKVQKRNAWEVRSMTLARAISVEGVGQEKADTKEGQQSCCNVDHRRIPWVTTMPKTAALRKWR
jgi:hypothetical protein